jgi:hypothetical protein
MSNVMLEKKWSAEKWGKEAQTSPTNITRFLSNDSSAIPNVATLEKLARAAGSAYPIGDLQKSSLYSVPVVDAALIAMIHWPAQTQEIQKMMKASTKAIQAAFPCGPNSFALEVLSHDLSQRAVVKGDIVIVDPDAATELFCLVAYRDADKVGFGELGEQFIMARTLRPSAPVPIEAVQIVGRIVQHVRKL